MGECYITDVMEVHKYNRVVLGFTRPCRPGIGFCIGST